MPAGRADRRLRLLRQALVEIHKAADEYDEERAGLGDRFAAAIEKALEVVHAAPEIWPLVDDRHHRYIVRRFPFSIFYRFDDHQVIIVAVAHRRRRPVGTGRNADARRPGLWLRRLDQTTSRGRLPAGSVQVEQRHVVADQ